MTSWSSELDVSKVYPDQRRSRDQKGPEDTKTQSSAVYGAMKGQTLRELYIYKKKNVFVSHESSAEDETTVDHQNSM